MCNYVSVASTKQHFKGLKMTYETINREILALFAVTGKEIPTEDSNLGRAVAILQEICGTQSHTIPEIKEGTSKEDAQAEVSDIFEALEEIENKIHQGEDDFNLEFDGAEYRLIGESHEVIWPIYMDSIKDIVEDCYSDVLKLDQIPSFIAVSVDWEQTAQNAYVDGYGHHFSSYDGSETTAGGYWIFRAN